MIITTALAAYTSYKSNTTTTKLTAYILTANDLSMHSHLILMFQLFHVIYQEKIIGLLCYEGGGFVLKVVALLQFQ